MQYLEAAFELVQGWQVKADKLQTMMHQYFNDAIPAFGNFADQDKYAGFVPSDHYLAMMMMKVIEHDEPDTNQHTACLPPNQIAIDDSHKVFL